MAHVVRGIIDGLRKMVVPRLIVTLSLVAVSGFAGSSPSAAAASVAEAAGGSSAQPLTKVTISFAELSGDHLPVFVAKEGEYFQANGLDATVSQVASASGMAALLSGDVQMAFLGGGAGLSANANGADVVMVATIAGVYPYYVEVGPDVQTAQDLKGKRVGVSQIGSSSDIATRAALRQLGVSESDVSIIAVGNAQNRTAAMLSGAIDVALASPPDSLAMEAVGAHVLLDLAGSGLPTANSAMQVQRSWMNAHRAEVQSTVDSIVQASVRVQNDPVYAKQILAQYLSLDDPVKIDATYDFHMAHVSAIFPYPRVEQLNEAIASLGPSNSKVMEYDPSNMIDDSFVRSAAERGVDKLAAAQ